MKSFGLLITLIVIVSLQYVDYAWQLCEGEPADPPRKGLLLWSCWGVARSRAGACPGSSSRHPRQPRRQESSRRLLSSTPLKQNIIITNYVLLNRLEVIHGACSGPRKANPSPPHSLTKQKVI